MEKETMVLTTTWPNTNNVSCYHNRLVEIEKQRVVLSNTWPKQLRFFSHNHMTEKEKHVRSHILMAEKNVVLRSATWLKGGIGGCCPTTRLKRGKQKTVSALNNVTVIEQLLFYRGTTWLQERSRVCSSNRLAGKEATFVAQTTWLNKKKCLFVDPQPPGRQQKHVFV